MSQAEETLIFLDVIKFDMCISVEMKFLFSRICQNSNHLLLFNFRITQLS